jgi:hypothetical protein
MANRNTGLSLTVASIFGNSVLADMDSLHTDTENKTAEGKGIADVDDWPVLVGAHTETTVNIQVPASGTAWCMGTALSANPAGTCTFTTGSGTISGTVVLTRVGHHIEREGIQMVPITLTWRGHPNFS